MEVSPSWAKGYSRMGTALFRLEKYDKAAEAYSKGDGAFRARCFSWRRVGWCVSRPAALFGGLFSMPAACWKGELSRTVGGAAVLTLAATCFTRQHQVAGSPLSPSKYVL